MFVDLAKPLTPAGISADEEADRELYCPQTYEQNMALSTVASLGPELPAR